MGRIRTVTIYTEPHNHGRRSGGSQDGNRSSLRRVRGARAQAVYGYRWVAEMVVEGKRYRCRSVYYDKVWAWLEHMRDRFSDEPVKRYEHEPGAKPHVRAHLY